MYKSPITKISRDARFVSLSLSLNQFYFRAVWDLRLMDVDYFMATKLQMIYEYFIFIRGLVNVMSEGHLSSWDRPVRNHTRSNRVPLNGVRWSPFKRVMSLVPRISKPLSIWTVKLCRTPRVNINQSKRRCLAFKCRFIWFLFFLFHFRFWSKQ